MDDEKKEKILSFSGKIFLCERVERLALEYVIKNPKVTADELSKVSLFGRRFNVKIKSPTVAQYYIDIVKKYL